MWSNLLPVAVGALLGILGSTLSIYLGRKDRREDRRVQLIISRQSIESNLASQQKAAALGYREKVLDERKSTYIAYLGFAASLRSLIDEMIESHMYSYLEGEKALPEQEGVRLGRDLVKTLDPENELQIRVLVYASPDFIEYRRQFQETVTLGANAILAAATGQNRDKSDILAEAMDKARDVLACAYTALAEQVNREVSTGFDYDSVLRKPEAEDPAETHDNPSRGEDVQGFLEERLAEITNTEPDPKLEAYYKKKLEEAGAVADPSMAQEIKGILRRMQRKKKK